MDPLAAQHRAGGTTCYAGVVAVTRFAAFLQRAGITGPRQIDRGVLDATCPNCTARWPASSPTDRDRAA